MPPRRRLRFTEKRKSRKPAKPASQTDDWWEVREIIDERPRGGSVVYLVDWEDNRRTGEKYQPTWVPARDVNEEAIEEWETLKKAKKESKEPEDQQPVATQSTQDSDESQPPQPPGRGQRQQLKSSVRRRFEDTEDGGEDQQGSRKRVRCETASPSLEPVPSITSSASLETANEDLPPVGQPPAPKITVELKREAAFDPSEYFSVQDSQSTAQSSQPLSELESQDRRITISSLLAPSTIPDSQEPSNNTESQQLHLQTQQSSILSSDHAVIPDSQDRWQTDSVSHNTISSDSKGISESQRIIPPSSSYDQSIPSHQPNHSRPKNNQEQRLENSASSGGSHLTYTGGNTANSLPRVPGAPTEATQEPTFFTQPNSAFSSLVSRETLENASPQAPRENSTANLPAFQGILEESDSRISQAAQVLYRPYYATEEQPATSQQTFPDSYNSLRRAGVNSAVSDRPAVASILPSTEQADPQTSLPQHLAPLESAKDSSGRTLSESNAAMSSSRDEAPPPPPARSGSAAEELSNLLNEPLDDSHTMGGAQGFSSAAAELAAFDAAEGHSNSQRPSSVNYYTQPGQGPSWTGHPPLSDQTASGSLAKTEADVDPPQPSAADELRDFMNQDYRPAIDSSASLMPPPVHELQQATVSPADVSQLGEADKVLTLLPSLADHEATSSGFYGASEPHITMAQIQRTGEPPVSSDEEEPIVTDHAVTLPFHASARSLYFETLLAYKEVITQFNEPFTSGVYKHRPPETELVEKINELFERLQNICDYPEDIVRPAIEEMSPEDKVKYAHGANAKFHFIFELLQGLRTGMNVLIVARTANLLRPLCELVKVLGLDYTCNEIGQASKDAHKNSAVHVTIALPDQSDPFLFELVIGYDSGFNNSSMSSDLTTADASKQKPVVLRLVTAYSLEHINLEIEDTQDSLKRQNMLLYAIVKGRHLITDPPRSLEPNEIAKAFIDYLNNDVEHVLWEADVLPSQVLDFYDQESSPPSQMSPVNPENGRKRKLDEEEDAETKRMRRFSRAKALPAFDVPPLTNEVRELLEKAGLKSITNTASNETQMPVPVAILETLAAKFNEAERAADVKVADAEYKKVIDKLDQQVKTYEASMEEMYSKYRTALEDRTQFQNDATKTEALLLAQKGEAQKIEEKNAAKIADLESRIARLTDDAATGSTLGATEKLLQETQEKVQVLEKRLVTAKETEDYIRNSYQDASSSASSLKAENEQLKEQNADLQKKASDNFRNVHEINKWNSARQHLRQIAELQTRLKERETELDRTREELRQAKNGRRETRQVSVPRSPRMGIMSPRAPRVAGSVSRGASPAPAMAAFDAGAPHVPGVAGGGAPGAQYTPAGGNGRWGPGNLR